MSRDFPDQIDPWKAAEGRRRFAGDLRLSQLARLKPLLALEQASDEVEPPVAEFDIEFGQNAEGRVMIDVQVSARLPLRCQRSLERFELPVATESQVTVIERPEQEEELPEGLDAVLLTEGRLELKRLVEEELLLAVPPVPVAPDSETVSWSTGETPEVDKPKNPFAVLESLKSDN